MSRRSETTLIFFVMYLSSLKSKSCAGHKSYTSQDNLIIFGSYIYQVKYKSYVQE